MTRLITLINPNKVHPPITPYALDVLTTALERNGYPVEVVDLCFERDNWPRLLEEYFTSRRPPLLVGFSVRNTDNLYAQQQRVFLPEHREIVRKIRTLTSAPMVGGGVGFSATPFACVDYLGLNFGVKGPGERILVDLADRLSRHEDPASVPGLLVNHGDGRVTRSGTPDPDTALGAVGEVGMGQSRAWQVDTTAAYTRRSGNRWRVDNLGYYERGGLGNILTKNGCPYACAHCVEPDAKGTAFAKRSVPAVVDELAELVGQGVYDVHTADSEFNLAIANSKAVLREIVRRKNTSPDSPLHRLRLWIYAQPKPFDDEFAELLAAAGCAGVNVAPDHVRDDMLDGWKVTAKGTRFYTWADTENAVQLCHKYGMATLVEVLAGMPGETWQTLREAIDRTLALDATVSGFSLGLRCFPYQPLGRWLAGQSAGIRHEPGTQSNTATEPIVLRTPEQCLSPVEYERQFLFQADGTVRPVFYFSPGLPEDPATVADPAGRRLRTVEMMWEHIGPAEYPRVMLPTAPGSSKDDNNYADNPFLTALTALGYRGAFWAKWRERDAIIAEAGARVGT
ncbi:tryptophan 2-C-methyltransferase [Streptomyces sp. SID3343]|uniref:tryptophan 2-C-methyltransferase n=1 Tax=Streptomyces sp. SID3343 TaxID=2690260 RepID=UPI00136DA970|nr:tryptophan 2-C-methyltransferase [Streptomyces sp. SID3343]